MTTTLNPTKSKRRSASLSPDNPSADNIIPPDQISRVGESRIEIELPIESVVLHPFNRATEPDQVKHLAELIEMEGQRDAIECRIAAGKDWWERADEYRVTTSQVQVLRGAHRTLAMRSLKRKTIRAVVFAAVSDAQALAMIARGDDQKKWSEFEKGRLIAAMQQTGLTLEQAAATFNAHKSTASHWVSLSRLPREWHELVSQGWVLDKKDDEPFRLPASWLRPLEKFSDNPEFLSAFARHYRQEMAEEYNRPTTREDIEDELQTFIRSLGAVDEGDQPHSTWGPNYKSIKVGRLFEMDAAIEKQLGIVSIEISEGTGKGAEKKLVRRATNVELYEKLQEPYLKKIREGKITPSGRPIKQKPDEPAAQKGKAKQKGDAESRKTPEQIKREAAAIAAAEKARRAAAANHLKDRIERWRTMSLRRSIAEILRRRPDHSLVPLLATSLADVGGAPMGRTWWQDAVAIAATGNAKLHGHRQSGMFRTLLAGMHDKNSPTAAELQGILAIAVSLMLWPQVPSGAKPGKSGFFAAADAPGQSDRLPFLEDEILDFCCAQLQVSIDEVWKHDANAEVLAFLELHTTDQLRDLCVEFKHDQYQPSVGRPMHVSAAALKKQQLIEHLLARHQPGKPLPLPRSLTRTAKGK